jgi:hypothetical protein
LPRVIDIWDPDKSEGSFQHGRFLRTLQAKLSISFLTSWARGLVATLRQFGLPAEQITSPFGGPPTPGAGPFSEVLAAESTTTDDPFGGAFTPTPAATAGATLASSNPFAAPALPPNLHLDSDPFGATPRREWVPTPERKRKEYVIDVSCNPLESGAGVATGDMSHFQHLGAC